MDHSTSDFGCPTEIVPPDGPRKRGRPYSAAEGCERALLLGLSSKRRDLAFAKSALVRLALQVAAERELVFSGAGGRVSSASSASVTTRTMSLSWSLPPPPGTREMQQAETLAFSFLLCLSSWLSWGGGGAEDARQALRRKYANTVYHTAAAAAASPRHSPWPPRMPASNLSGTRIGPR